MFNIVNVIGNIVLFRFCFENVLFYVNSACEIVLFSVNKHKYSKIDRIFRKYCCKMILMKSSEFSFLILKSLQLKRVKKCDIYTM